MKKNPRWKPMLIGVLASAALFATASDAKDEAPVAQNVKTVWIDGKGQSNFAEKLNKIHGAMEAEGWKFSDSEIYTEDGDMQGMFVTYVR